MKLAMLIADDCQNDIKAALRKSLRHLRGKALQPTIGQLTSLHDGMYFGSSQDSSGIQLADLCCYIIAKHLEGDPLVAGFYDIIKDRIVYSQVEPKE